VLEGRAIRLWLLGELISNCHRVRKGLNMLSTAYDRPASKKLTTLANITITCWLAALLCRAGTTYLWYLLKIAAVNCPAVRRRSKGYFGHFIHILHSIVEFLHSRFFPTMIRCPRSSYANIKNLKMDHTASVHTKICRDEAVACVH
jgi:hypothetical protein